MTEFDEMLPEFTDLARQIFDAGRRAERERLRRILEGTPDAPVSRPPRTRSATPPAGGIKGPVRDAVVRLSSSLSGGVSADEVFEFFVRAGGGPTRLQIRSALKNLALSGDLVRESRGRYSVPSAEAPASGGENPDADASGPLYLAAE